MAKKKAARKVGSGSRGRKPSRRRPKDPELGAFSAKVCNQLREMVGRRSRLKGKMDELTKARKSIDTNLAEKNSDEKSKKYRELMADWGIVQHQLSGVRADLADIAGKMDNVIRGADQGEFEFTEGAEGAKPDPQMTLPEGGEAPPKAGADDGDDD